LHLLDGHFAVAAISLVGAVQARIDVGHHDFQMGEPNAQVVGGFVLVGRMGFAIAQREDPSVLGGIEIDSTALRSDHGGLSAGSVQLVDGDVVEGIGDLVVGAQPKTESVEVLDHGARLQHHRRTFSGDVFTQAGCTEIGLGEDAVVEPGEAPR
jgi:hypothetical protein